MKNKIIMRYERQKTGDSFDLEVPLNITVNELLNALNQGLHLGINREDVSQCYLTTENPIALLKGDVLLEEYGLHDGTKLFFTR